MVSRWVLLLALGAACARTVLDGSVVDEHGGADEFAEMDFWDALASAPAVSNNDALHALLLAFGKAPPNYGARVAAGRKRRWIATNEDLPRNETARVGWIARAICIETGIQGGATMRVVGPRERYAVKELNYMGWLPDMSKEQALSGAQLIALLGHAEDHETGGPDEPREDM